MDGKLHCEVIQRIKGMTRIKSFLILAMATLDLAIVARRIGSDQFMPNVQFCGSFLEKGK